MWCVSFPVWYSVELPIAYSAGRYTTQRISRCPWVGPGLVQLSYPPLFISTHYSFCPLYTPYQAVLCALWHFGGFHKGCTALASGNLLLVVTPGTVQPPLGVKCNLLSRKLFLLSQVCLSFSSFLYDHKRLCSKHWLKDLILDHGPVPWRGLSL